MPAFFDYMRNIAYYLVFMAVVGVIVPSGNYKKYIALVMGIMLIGVVLRPAAAFLDRPQLPMTDLFGNVIPPAIGEHSSHIEPAFHYQLSNQVSALLLRNGFELISAEWETSEDFTYIRQVSLKVRMLETEPAPRPFIRVEPVRIGPYQPSEEPEETKIIKNLISDFYNMDPANIHVIVN